MSEQLTNQLIVIIDYGLGNLFSVERALNKVGASNTKISFDKRYIEAAAKLVLPGVGAFGDGMRNLEERDIVSSIQEFTRSGKPVLGVCLGMQLMMSQSEEFGPHEGLNLVQGNVRRLECGGDDRLKVPHIGWNSLNMPHSRTQDPAFWQTSVLAKIEDGASMYFNHSYVVVPDDSRVPIAITMYGDDSYCSVLKQNNITGAQFHPELSGEDGLSLYRSFVHGN